MDGKASPRASQPSSARDGAHHRRRNLPREPKTTKARPHCSATALVAEIQGARDLKEPAGWRDPNPSLAQSSEVRGHVGDGRDHCANVAGRFIIMLVSECRIVRSLWRQSRTRGRRHSQRPGCKPCSRHARCVASGRANRPLNYTPTSGLAGTMRD